MSEVEALTGDLLSFACPALINMANRPTRLRDSLRELSIATGRPVTVDEVHLIRPRRFDDAGGFASPGFRSNLDAHLRAATWARDAGHERVLIMEDDLSFRPDLTRVWPALAAELLVRPWHLASLGYLDSWGEAPTAPDHLAAGTAGGEGDRRPAGWARFEGKVNGAHAYLVHARALDEWVTHLATIATGRPGDDLLGPIPSDGAINTFTWVDDSRTRLVAVPNMVGTRPTRSDITPGRLDRVPVIGPTVELLRRWRRHRHGAAVTNFGAPGGDSAH